MVYLDFEKPLAEIEEHIRQLEQRLSGEDGSSSELRKLRERAEKLTRKTYEDLSVWQKVQLSRHPDRPYFADYIERIIDDFIELHGDRSFADDAAIMAGFGTFEGRHVAVIGQQKGRSTKDKVRHNFGMAHPEGYRKACRVMELANRYGRPVLTFIDTAGAYPGLGAEERGQSEAIGESLLVMSGLRVPVIAVVIGEGGSGGALALGVANRVLMMSYATYSVISPEGCASILWRDGARAPEASEQLKLLAADAKALGIADDVIDEPLGGAHRNHDEAAQAIKQGILRHLIEIEKEHPDKLVENRYQRFRKLGPYSMEDPT